VILPVVRGYHRLEYPPSGFAADEEELFLLPGLLLPQAPSMLGRDTLCHPIPAVQIHDFNMLRKFQIKILIIFKINLLFDQKIITIRNLNWSLSLLVLKLL